ncbi:MAG TPA: hypothetical protein VLM85_28810 [Polyangiaceae bacterium]|nr:hypothetical protein [Polyangiaceae bacterium]
MKKSLTLVSSLLVLGAGLMRCSSDNTATDAGTDATNKPDVVKPDVSQPDVYVAPVTPAGALLALSDKIQVFGVTADDQVIYADGNAANALFAVDAAGGGTPTKIASPTVSSSSTYIAGIAGKVVFVWEGVSTAANAAQVGTLHLWKKGGTYVSAVTSDAGTGKSCASAGTAASTDGSKVIFSANSNTTCTLGDIVGANSDGTSPATLAAGVDLGTDCSPFIGFAGGTVAVTATCATAPGDGGTPSATINSYNASWTPTLILAGALDFWSSDSAGTKLFVGTPVSAQVFPIGGGAPTVIDTKNLDKGFAYMAKDGSHVIYSTGTGDLYSATVATVPAITTLQTTGVKVVRSYSDDESHVIFNTNFDAQQFGSDLFLASLTAAGTPVTLEPGTTGALFGLTFADDFTADSHYAVYIKNLNASQGIGDLYAVATAGGNPAQITTNEWQNISATGSKIVFNDNCQNCSGTSASSGGTADIKAVDLSTTSTPTMLQAGADVSIFVNHARDHVIYTYSQNPPADDGGNQGNGLYAVAIP